MSTEIAHIDVQPGLEGDFLRAFREQAVSLMHAGGATDIVLYRSQVRAASFVMLARFTSREARLTEFMASPYYQDFVALFGQYLAKPPDLDDYDLVHADH